MVSINFTVRELNAICNCLNYTYENIDGDMSLMSDDEAHDEMVVVKFLSERIDQAIKQETE